MSLVSVRTFAPLAVMGATFLVRKGMAAGYKARTGHAPPTPDDREAAITKVWVWSLAVALVCASLEVAITRAAARSETDPDALALPQ